jgi:hypothetical protein
VLKFLAGAKLSTHLLAVSCAGLCPPANTEPALTPSITNIIIIFCFILCFSLKPLPVRIDELDAVTLISRLCALLIYWELG